MKKIFALLPLIVLLAATACSDGDKEAFNPAPKPSTAAPVADIVYEQGFYPLEKDEKADTSWRWMGSEGIVKVKNTKQDMTLKIAGSVPLERFPQPPAITVSVNGEEIGKFNATDGLMEKMFAVPAAKLGSGEFTEIKIATSKTFVPKDVVKGATDARALGFSLTTLTWQPK